MTSASSCVFREIRRHACSPCNPRYKTFRAGHRPSLSCPASRGWVFRTTHTPPSRCFAESGWLAPHYPPGPRSSRNAASGRRLGIERQGVDQGSVCLPTRQGGQAGRTLTEAEVTVRRLGGRNLPAGPKARTSEWLRRQGEYTTVAGRSSTGWGSSRSLSGRRACPRQNQAASRRTPGTEIVRRVRRAPPGIAARPRAGIKGLAGPMENTGLLVASRHGPGRKNVPAMTGRVRVNLPSLTD